MAGGAAAPDGKAGGVGAACREGSVIEPRRWFWRNSRGARGVTGVCRELMDGDDVLGWKAVPAEVALGESADIFWPELAGVPSAGVEAMENVGRRAAGAGTLLGAVSKYDNMDVQRQERVATILDNHVGQNYRPCSKRVTLPDTNHVPSPTALAASLSCFSSMESDCHIDHRRALMPTNPSELGVRAMRLWHRRPREASLP